MVGRNNRGSNANAACGGLLPELRQSRRNAKGSSAIPEDLSAGVYAKKDDHPLDGRLFWWKQQGSDLSN